MTWADERDARSPATTKDVAASLNAFTVAEASPQWFHLPGTSPPIASGSLMPLSARFGDGYTDDAARRSARQNTTNLRGEFSALMVVRNADGLYRVGAPA
jgi:hypothetical protein